MCSASLTDHALVSRLLAFVRCASTPTTRSQSGNAPAVGRSAPKNCSLQAPPEWGSTSCQSNWNRQAAEPMHPSPNVGTHRPSLLGFHQGSTAMRNHTFTLSDLDMLARHARYHGLHPPYLTADGRLAWLAFSSSSERVPLVPHPPRHPPPPPLTVTLTLVPTLTVTHGEGTSPAANGASKTHKLSGSQPGPPPSVLLMDQAKTPALTRPVAPTEASALGPVDVKSTKSQGAQTVIHRADGGAEHSTVRGETLEF